MLPTSFRAMTRRTYRPVRAPVLPMRPFQVTA
jgi:hypothetical protein